ncbi:MAG: hypothetical protein P1U90_16070 [Akkermansiaceae bacterium]|jgi:hypothetical protein|nr:hypothetical protein [Akkermansiaceae bacterium]
MKIKHLLAILLSTTALASADLISGLTIESATIGLNPEMGPEKAINGFGLDGDVPSLTASHRQQFSSNWWSGWSGEVTDWQITVDLEDNYKLDAIHIWNYREGCCQGRGLRSVEIYVASEEDETLLVKLVTDGTGANDNDQGGFLLPRAPADATYTGFDLDVSGVTNAELLNNVRLFRIDGASDLYGEGEVHGGLAEIQFDGIPATTGPDGLALEITPTGDTLSFTWAGKDGRLYDLVSSSDLSTPPGEWPVYEGNSNIIGSALTEVPFDGNTRFFALIEKNLQ